MPTNQTFKLFPQTLDQGLPGKCMYGLDTATGHWGVLSTLPDYTHHHGVVAIGDFIYVIGKCQPPKSSIHYPQAWVVLGAIYIIRLYFHLRLSLSIDVPKNKNESYFENPSSFSLYIYIYIYTRPTSFIYFMHVSFI